MQSRLFAIKRYMEEETDEAHPVTLTDILDYLDSAGISASRKSVEKDINELIEDGVGIVRNTGNPAEYFMGDRHFEMPELKLIADAVRASRFIPPKKSDALIGKLAALTSRHLAGELRRSLYTGRQSWPSSEKAYFTADMINTAINTGKKISFMYFDWGPDKKRVYKHRRQDYCFSPYGLIWNNDRYYAVGWSDSHGKVITLRVDRIATPRQTGKSAVPKPKDFDMAFYAESVVQMYDGLLREITLLCANDMMRHVIDRFGEDVDTRIVDEGHFEARVSVPASPTFFAWVFTFGGEICITSPDDVLLCYRDMALKALSQ